MPPTNCCSFLYISVKSHTKIIKNKKDTAKFTVSCFMYRVSPVKTYELNT